MEITPELIFLLQGHFNWNLARTKSIAAILIGLIKIGTVNLSQLCLAIPGTAQTDSKYRRLQRLFSELRSSPERTAVFIAERLNLDKYTLAMDRTNWKFGVFNINILCLAIVYEGIAVPVLWSFLLKKGNSNTQERIDLMNRFIRIFGVDCIDCLLADREFVGRDWFVYLFEKNIKFRIRIKQDALISKRHGGKSPAKNFCRPLKPGETFCLDGKRDLWGVSVYVTCTRLESEYLIIASFDMPGCKEIITDYKKRWKIETMFKAMKTGGFNFEDTHLKCHKKLELLMEFVAISFCWACISGVYRNIVNEIKVRSHNRKSSTIFRYGLDFLKEVFLNPIDKFQEALHAVGLLKNGVINSNIMIL